MHPLLEQRVETIRGGIAGLARKLGVSRQAVFQWDEIPESRVLQLEEVAGISRHDLRPDLYPRKKRAPKKPK